jgi:uncharacterized protein
LPTLDLALLAAIAIILAAAIVRGFSGFGLSIMSIPALTMIYPARAVIPVIFLMEVAASLHMLPGIWRDIHWKSLAPLIVGCIIATPIGTWLLTSLNEATARVGLSIFVLACVALMWRGVALSNQPGRLAATLAGAASGLANGATGVGGPPVILFYFSATGAAATSRASIIAFFLFTDSYGLATQSYFGLLSADVVWRFVVMLPVLLIGIWIGSRLFTRVNPDQFRRLVLVLIAVLSAINGITAVLP